MMKRPRPSDDAISVISSDDDDDSSSDPEAKEIKAARERVEDIINNFAPVLKDFKDPIERRASMYQEYMKRIPVPVQRASVIPFNSWVGLGRSIKELYGQPLHYLTNVQLREWDKARLGSEDEDKPLDQIIHPVMGEVRIWLMEEAHRKTTSYYHIAKLWKDDPTYYRYIDDIFTLIV